MKIYKILSIVLISSLVLSAGCSKKQEEADKLQDEILGQIADSAAMIDSTDIIESAAAMVEEEPVIEEEPELAMPSRPEGDGYTVQVAGCESEDYARHLVNVYTGRGYEPFVSRFSYDGQTYHRVRIGMFDDIAEAKQLVAELEDRYSISPWIDFVTKEF